MKFDRVVHSVYLRINWIFGVQLVWITGCYVNVKKPSLPYYLSITRQGTVGFMLFPRALVKSEIQTALSRIWLVRFVGFYGISDTQDTAGEARMNSSVMYSYGPQHMAKQKQDDQLERTYSSYVRRRDVTLKTCQKQGEGIGRSGERGSGISVLEVRHDDDDDGISTFVGYLTPNPFLCK